MFKACEKTRAVNMSCLVGSSSKTPYFKFWTCYYSQYLGVNMATWPCVSLWKIITHTHTGRIIHYAGFQLPNEQSGTSRGMSWWAPLCHHISGWASSAAWIRRLLGDCSLSAEQQLPCTAVQGCNLWKMQQNWSKLTTKSEQVKKKRPVALILYSLKT